MSKFFSLLLIAAFFTTASAFTAPEKPASSSSREDSPNMGTVLLKQTGPGTALGSWTSTTAGPFSVTFTDLTTGVRLQTFVTPLLQWPFTNLTAGHTYRLTVGDFNILFDDELIQ